MNWKLLIGQAIGKADRSLIGSGLSFINKNYPYRRNWIFDLKRIIKDAHLIIDVGAFVGDVTVELNKWFPSATIYSFEPINESFEKLEKATKKLVNVHTHNLAIGDKNETLEIPIYAEGSINTLKNVQYDSGPKATQQINVVRLDNFLSEHKITDSIDILKIDVEGYELEVLKGLGTYLNQVKYIFTEVGYQRTASKTHFSDMEAFMEANGFEIFNIYELMPAYNDRTKLHFSNNLYVNKKFSGA